jgi:RNA polymerase sigma-70 factor (ECF subfamily)
MHRDDLDLEVPAPDRSEARDAGLSVTGRAFQAALQALSPKQRACLVLHELEDLPFAEVAREVGCAEATARVHHHRATQRMRELLEQPADEMGGQQA